MTKYFFITVKKGFTSLNYRRVLVNILKVLNIHIKALSCVFKCGKYDVIRGDIVHEASEIGRLLPVKIAQKTFAQSRAKRRLPVR